MATTLGWFDLDFWWELAALITIMLLGHWMEMRAIGQARGALAALAELLPDEAERIIGGGAETVPISVLAVGDLVLVRPGAGSRPTAMIVDGDAEIDESMVTGESKPVQQGGRETEWSPGPSPPTRRSGSRSPRSGTTPPWPGSSDSSHEAQQSRSRAQVLADRAAALLFYVAVAAAAITASSGRLLGQPDAGGRAHGHRCW